MTAPQVEELDEFIEKKERELRLILVKTITTTMNLIKPSSEIGRHKERGERIKC
jgi:hypothetical protein